MGIFWGIMCLLYYLRKYIVEYLISRMKAILILISLLLIGYLTSAKGVEDTAKTIRNHLTQLSLSGKWKLLKDNNFLINKRNEMINDISIKRTRSYQKISFLAINTEQRQAQGYFQSQSYGQQPNKLYLELYDGKFITNKTIILEINLENSLTPTRNEQEGINIWWNNQSVIVVCSLLVNKKVIAKMSVQAKYEIYSNVKIAQLGTDKAKYFLKFQSDSFSFYSDFGYAGEGYDILVNIYAISSGLLLLLILATKAGKSVYSISQWMILQAAAFSLVTSILFIKLSFEKIDTSLRYVGIIAFFNICITFFFLRKYEEVLKSFKGLVGTGLALAVLSTYIYTCFYFSDSLVFWIYQSFVLLALQVTYSYWVGGRGGITIQLIGMLILMRVSFFYYLFNCPQITRNPIDHQLQRLIIMVHAVLFLFFGLQRYFGSRFIVPKELIPDYFDYYKRMESSHKALEEMCPICTLKLKQKSALKKHEDGDDDDDDDEQQEDEQTNEQKQGQNGDRSQIQTSQASTTHNVVVTNDAEFTVIMQTPCKHHFHSECLLEWMEKRLQCPVCRGILPASQRQRDGSYCC